LSQFVYINFYKTTLSAAMTSTQTTMTVGSATGLPTLTTGQVLPLVLTSASNNTVHEIVYVTAISSNTLTIERGQEGTAGNTWAIGDYVSCDTTAGSVVASGDDVSFGTVDATGLITANGGLTVPSGQTATVAGTVDATGLITANGGLTVPSGQTATVAGTLDVTGSATVPAATASTNPVNLGQFPNSLASAGYQKLPNGLIIQWQVVGLPSTNASSGSTSFNFPIAFPNGFLSGQAIQDVDVPAIIILGIYSPTTSGARLTWAGSGSPLTGGTTCWVMVIGY